MYEFDIVIPVGPNDTDFLRKYIDYNKRNIIGYRNIYIVTKDISIPIEGCIMIDESIYPFKWNDIVGIIGEDGRIGWYFQQLLKLYSSSVIPDILPRYLVIDADVVFLKPTTFVENGKMLFNVGNEYHTPYFEHMSRLHPTLKKYIQQSGICHTMLFDRYYIEQLFEMVESFHQGKKFWEIFLEKVTEPKTSGASEYEIYFNYMIRYNSDIIQIRNLKWSNTHTLILDNDLNYVAIHHYNR
jgi:hypothetical protein